MSPDRSLQLRSARHAALGDPIRLAIVDELILSDRSPVELRRLIGVESNRLAHHLDALEEVGLITRSRSSGDKRRRYVSLHSPALEQLRRRRQIRPSPVLFVCTHNSARSQLAAALWTTMADAPAESAGTRPARRVHPGAVAAAHRAGFDLSAARPKHLDELRTRPEMVVTVCDRAHEEMGSDTRRLHWSIPDPVPIGTRRAFDLTVSALHDRIAALVSS